MSEPQVDPEDVGGYTFPSRASELRDMPDDDMFRLLRRVAFDNKWGVGEKIQFEAMGRNIKALKDFRRSSERTARLLVWLTTALVVLTLALVGLTVAVLWLTAQLA